MGRADAKDRHQRRAREDLEKGLKRNDSALACAGLLGLPPEQRTASMGAVARLLRREALDLFTRRQWAALRLLSTRFDQEPLLVSTDDAGTISVEAVAELRWALLWASIHQQQWREAAQRLQLLSLPQALHEALTALTEGRLTPELLPTGCNEDVRPTSDAVRGRAAAPQAAVEVEGALADLVASRSFGTMASALRDWLPRSPPDVVVELRRVACDLTLRELLMRAQEPALGSLCEPAVLLSELATDADDASSHAAVIALRLVARALAPPVIAGAAAPEIVDRPLAQALLTLAVTVSQRPRQRTIALRLIEGLRFHKDLAAVAGPGLEALCVSGASVGMWTEALRLWVVRSHAGTAPPSWLITTLGALVGDDAFGRLFSGPAIETRRELRNTTLDLMAYCMPPALAERACDQAFAVADEEARSVVAGAVNDLLDRLRTEFTAPPGGWKSLLQRQTFLELLEAVGDDCADTTTTMDNARDDGLTPAQAAEVVALVDKHAKGTVVVPQERALWSRWSQRLLPVHPRFLARVVAECANTEDAVATARRHLDRRTDVASWYRALDVLDGVDRDGLKSLGVTFAPLLVEHFAGDLGALARAFVLSRSAPRPTRIIIARALLAIEAQGSDTPEIRHAISAARRLIDRNATATATATATTTTMAATATATATGNNP